LDLAASRLLCSQLLKYRNNESPYNQPYTKEDNIIKWWISLELTTPYLQQLALHLFSICPNSASCERGFSICGWLSNKRRLRLGVERLESMMKLISYYRSNASNELGFYGKGVGSGSMQLSDVEVNAIVNEALAEGEDDDDENENEENDIRRTTDGHIIPNHEVRIFIEDTLNLSNKTIIQELGENPSDDLEDDDDKPNEGNETIGEELNGKGVKDFNVEELANEFRDK
jgi:hypothetical protein